jgi:hypothetical protein
MAFLFDFFGVCSTGEMFVGSLIVGFCSTAKIKFLPV